MMRCPYCTREIATGETLCPHCGRDLSTPVTLASALRARIKHLRLGITVTVVVLVALALWRGLARPASSAAPAAATPREGVHIPLGTPDTLAIAASGGWQQALDLPDRACTATGEVRGVAGGKKDFEAFLSDDQGYRDWDAGHPFEVRWRTAGQVTSAIFTVPIHGPGLFHFVVSNRFSMVTGKVVRVAGMVDCP